MKRLHSFIVKSYIGPLVLTFFIAMFILLMQFLWKYIDDLVGKGLDFSIIAELLLYASAGLVPMALPLSILLSSIMTFGNLGEHNELLSIKSSGISLQRIMFPLIVLTVLISIGAFFFSNNVMPYTNLRYGALLFDIRHQRPELDIQEGIFNNDIDGYTIKVGDKNRETNMMYDFILYDHTQHKGNTMVSVADSASMSVTEDKRYLILYMYDGYGYEEVYDDRQKRRNEYPLRRSEFKKQRVLFNLEGFQFEKTDKKLFKHHYQMMNLQQLNEAIDSLSDTFIERRDNFVRNLITTNYIKTLPKRYLKKDTLGTEKNVAKAHERLSKAKPVDMDSMINNLDDSQKQRITELAENYGEAANSYIRSTSGDFDERKRWINKHKIEWHRKFTLSFACFIFFFIGAPLGAIIRKGGLGIPVVISVIFFIIYYVVSLMSEKFVREGFIPAYLGMWFSSAILLPLGIFLTYKATNDSVILRIDTYFDMLKKIFRIKRT